MTLAWRSDGTMVVWSHPHAANMAVEAPVLLLERPASWLDQARHELVAWQARPVRQTAPFGALGWTFGGSSKIRPQAAKRCSKSPLLFTPETVLGDGPVDLAQPPDLRRPGHRRPGREQGHVGCRQSSRHGLQSYTVNPSGS